MPKSCWSRSLMWEVLSSVSYNHRNGLSISKSTRTSCGVCFVQFSRRHNSCGRTNHGCLFMTVHLLTTPWASGSFWLRGTSLYWNNLTRSCSVWCFPSYLKRIMNRTRFEGVEIISWTVTTEMRGIPEESFQQWIEGWQRKKSEFDRKGIIWRETT